MVQWRAWIGPRWREISEGGAAETWLSIVSTAIPLAERATTLQSSLLSGVTTATLTSAANYPTPYGWAFIGPNGGGQGWEYVDYAAVSANNLTGLTRESTATREHNGIHSSGAPVRLFWPLTTDNGQLNLVETMDDALGMVTWQATISGVRLPQASLRHAHCIAIEYLAVPAGDWEMLLGWVETPQIQDDDRRRGEWTVSIMPAVQMVGRTRIDGVRVGQINWAENASASGDTVLIDPRKERNSGDYIAAAPALEHASAVDGDAETLWIGERLLGTADPNTFPGAFDEFASQIRLWMYPGEPKGYRWIEFVGVSNELNRQLCNSDASVDVLVELSDIPDGDGRLAIVEDAQLFAEMNPLASNRIVEIGSAIFDLFDTTQDCVALMTPGSNAWSNVVAWGNGSDDLKAKHENSPDPDEYSEEWPGDHIPPPAAGEIIRYRYNGSASQRRDHFVVDEADHALYNIGDGVDPWLLVELPGMGLELEEDIEDDEPGANDTLYLVDAGGNRSTGGLPYSGTLQIATEQITYSAKTEGGVIVTARGANGSVAAPHVAGDAVYMLDGSTATNGAPIKSVTISRPTGSVTWREFTLRVSNLERARVPTDDNYTGDYTAIATVTNNSADTYTVNLSPSKRVRWLMMEIDKMEVDPYRPRLNEFEAILDEAFYHAQSWLTGTVYAGEVIKQALVNAGLPESMFAITLTGMAAVEGFSTARDLALTVAADFADYAGCLVTVERGSSISIKANTLWSADSHTPVETWTRNDVRRVEVVQQVNRGVSQVIVPWRTPDESDSGEAKYPATPDAAGAPLTLDEMLFASAETAQNAAKRRYIMERFSWRFVMEMAQGLPGLRPGVVYGLTWQFDASQPALTRTLLLVEVDHTVSAGVWKTTCVGLQLDREATN